jgi:hypothetical protein
MRAYPTVATNPNRKQRKGQRGVIFAENKANTKTRRAARKTARKEV